MAKSVQPQITKEQAKEVYEWVLSDLKTLEKMARAVITKLPPTGSMLPDDLYLEMSAINILAISQLEYFLKYLGKIEYQYGIIKIIETTKTLTQKEKDHLIHLFLVRHTLVHNGGNYDEKFFKGITEHIKEIKVVIPANKSYLTTIDPTLIVAHIHIIEKLIEDCLKEVQ